ncbi:MAG TPA: adenylate/guanylate cyclase domain-containing protein [Bryobacteraceae bacterium]|nr:adenylate/guanylate cyclase domain-containing protein [Bryobacteraceae bacterium]
MDASVADAYLQVEGTGRRFPLANGQSWAVGRGDGCSVLLDSRSVSRLHALIQRKDAGDFSLVDLGSRNGSFVNGRRVTVPVTLTDNDRLVFGDQQLLFRSSTGPSSGGSAVDTNTRNAPTTSIHAHTLTTIVVVDIRDFTPMARTLPEQVLSQTIGTWFLRVGQIAQRFGSWAQKYIGDAVMLVWVHDDPTRLPADLLRALRAIDEIHIATGEISRSLSLPVPLRIGAGVNTGPAIIGSTDYTALGDTVNIAFRLEAATKSLGLGIAMGERSFEALTLPGPEPFVRRVVALKGYESPSTAWAVTFEDLQRFLRGYAG